MGTEPVAALHVLRCPGKQQLTEAQISNKHIRLADLTGLQLDPLERIAGIIHFHALARIKLARGDAGLTVLWELTVELFPKVGVRRQVLGSLLPDELQWVPQPQIVNDGWPLQLQHPQRIAERLRRIGGLSRAVAYLAHGIA